MSRIEYSASEREADEVEDYSPEEVETLSVVDLLRDVQEREYRVKR